MYSIRRQNQDNYFRITTNDQKDRITYYILTDIIRFFRVLHSKQSDLTRHIILYIIINNMRFDQTDAHRPNRETFTFSEYKT